DGACCGGRCCVGGGTCSTNVGGWPVCCTTCHGASAQCCDNIDVMTSATVVGYSIEAAACLEGTGNCASCPVVCVASTTHEYLDLGAGKGVCGVGNACGVLFANPVGGFL